VETGDGGLSQRKGEGPFIKCDRLQRPLDKRWEFRKSKISETLCDVGWGSNVFGPKPIPREMILAAYRDGPDAIVSPKVWNQPPRRDFRRQLGVERA